MLVTEHHSFLQARRQEQQTEAFQQRMKHRNAIEGTQSERVRTHGMRHARYRGLAKVKPQNYWAGSASGASQELQGKPCASQQESFTITIQGAYSYGFVWGAQERC